MATRPGRWRWQRVTSWSPYNIAQGRGACSSLRPRKGRAGAASGTLARQHLPLSGCDVGVGLRGLKKGPGGPAEPQRLREGRGRVRSAAHHGLLHLHLDDVLVDVVPFILARDAVVDVLPQVVLAAREGSGQREGRCSQVDEGPPRAPPPWPPAPGPYKMGWSTCLPGV